MIEKVLSRTKEEIVKAKPEINSATDSIREQMRYQKDTDIEDVIRNRNARELQYGKQFANNGNFRAHNN